MCGIWKQRILAVNRNRENGRSNLEKDTLQAYHISKRKLLHAMTEGRFAV